MKCVKCGGNISAFVLNAAGKHMPVIRLRWDGPVEGRFMRHWCWFGDDE